MAEKFKKYRIRKPSEQDIGDANYADPDKDGIITIDEIPDPAFDMKYYEYNEKIIKKLEIAIRGSFEYKGLFMFIKTYLNVDHCAFYEQYSIKNGLTIELHHAPFTLYDITEAVVAKSMHDKGYYEIDEQQSEYVYEAYDSFTDETTSYPAYIYISDSAVKYGNKFFQTNDYGTVILADKPTLIETIAGENNYGDSINEWERRGTVVDRKIWALDSTGETDYLKEFKTYNPGVDWSNIAKEKKYYVYVVHFSDNSSAISCVYTK